MAHRCKGGPSNEVIAAAALFRDGQYSTYQSCYEATCPACGAPKRNWRLATAIHMLRTELGWSITTLDTDDKGANYVLNHVGIITPEMTRWLTQ